VYVRQSSLFSFEQWLEIEPSERRVRFFSALDLSPYAAKLRSSTTQGAKPFSREAILRAFLAAPLEGISTFTQLHRRLESDLRVSAVLKALLAARARRQYTEGKRRL